MRTRSFLVLFALLAAALALAQDQPKPSEYASLVARAKAGETNVDFQRMRLSYMESPERRQAKDTSKEEEAMIAAINAKDFETALQNADAVVANQFVNLDGHFAAFIANRELHHDQQATLHRAVFRGLLDSIMNSGDGRSTKTAWTVISVHEEYVVLRFLGMMPSKQSVSHEGDRSFDVMECKDRKSGESVTLYFDVTIPMKHYMD